MSTALSVVALLAASTPTETRLPRVVSIDERAVYWLEGSMLARFDRATGKRTATFEAPSEVGLEVRPIGTELEVRTADALTWLDASLVVRSRCKRPEGWSWTPSRGPDRDVVASADAWAIFNTRTCALTPLPQGIATHAAPGAVLRFSPSRRVVAIDADASTVSDRTVVVLDFPSLTVRARVTAPEALYSAKFGAAGLVSVADDGTLQWERRGDPCFGIEGDLLPIEGSVFTTTSRIVKAEPVAAGCPRPTKGTRVQELARLPAGITEVIHRAPGVLVATAPGRAWVISFAKGNGRYDYASPRVRPLAR